MAVYISLYNMYSTYKSEDVILTFTLHRQNSLRSLECGPELLLRCWALLLKQTAGVVGTRGWNQKPIPT